MATGGDSSPIISGQTDDGTKQTGKEFISQLNEELRLVLIGKTGVGKSATGNTILGKVAFKAKATMKSVTTHSQSHERRWKSKKVVVIDTPGLYDDIMPMKEVKHELIRGIHMSFPGPHAFLYVISAILPVNEQRMDSFKWFLETFGEQVYDFLIIIFVRKEDTNYMTFEEFLKKELNDSLLEIVKKIGDKRCFWLNNKALEEEKKTQNETVESILKTITELNQHLPESYYTNTTLKKGNALYEYLMCAIS